MMDANRVNAAVKIKLSMLRMLKSRSGIKPMNWMKYQTLQNDLTRLQHGMTMEEFQDYSRRIQ